MSVKEMIKKEVDLLPENLLIEVYDFILFIENKRDKDSLIKGATVLSARSFDKIWDNEEDAVYDDL